MGHFFPSYTFDLDNTIYLVTSGRYEYRNKGMDMFIEALYRLNQRLKDVVNAPTVIAFIITKAPVKNVNVQVLQNQSMFEDMRHTCTEIAQQMGKPAFPLRCRGPHPEFCRVAFRRRTGSAETDDPRLANQPSAAYRHA